MDAAHPNPEALWHDRKLQDAVINGIASHVATTHPERLNGLTPQEYGEKARSELENAQMAYSVSDDKATRVLLGNRENNTALAANLTNPDHSTYFEVKGSVDHYLANKQREAERRGQSFEAIDLEKMKETPEQRIKQVPPAKETAGPQPPLVEEATVPKPPEVPSQPGVSSPEPTPPKL